MKTQKIKILLALVIGATGLTVTAQNAALTTTVVAESTVQYSTTASTGITNYISGYDKMKSFALSPNASAKTYFKYDFTGQNPNTNYDLTVTWQVNHNNGLEHFNVWALNQAYPSFTNPSGSNNPSLTWNGAQANNTLGGVGGTDDLLTGGSFTATLWKDFVGKGSTTVAESTTLPAPWGQYLINNQLVIVVTATNDTTITQSANGGRFNTNSSTISFQPLTVSTKPPIISYIAPQTVKSTTASGNISFTVGDPQDGPNGLVPTVALGNTNVTLTVTNLGGSGANRTLSFTPVSNKGAGVTATVTVTVTVTDLEGNSASSSFLLTVPPFITLPVVYSGTNVNYLPPTNRVGVGSVTIPFQVVDTNITASSLIVTGAVVSADVNGNLLTTNLGTLSFTSVVGGANSNNCSVTINAIGSGVGVINVLAIDPQNLVTDVVSLAVMVLPDNSYAVYDAMHYQPSTSYSASSGHESLSAASGGLWNNRTVSGTVDVITTVTPSSGGDIPVGTPVIRGSTSGNSDQLRLVGAPYHASGHQVLYASVMAQWADISFYGGNSYYPGNSTGGFVEFAADATSTGVAMAQVCTITNAANTATNDGNFYLALYNGTNSPSVNTGYQETIPNFSTSGILPNPTPDNIVVSYDTDTGISTLWVNQSSSTNANVTLQDVAVTNLANVSYLVLRQNGGMGNILIQSASVRVVNKPFPTITGITVTGSNVTITYTDTAGAGQSGFQQVWSSTAVNGTYSQVASGVTITDLGGGNYSAAISGQTGQTEFYKIKETGTAPSLNFPF